MYKIPTILLVFLICFLPLQAGALTIKSVTRDYTHPDIFHYKSHLIGKPQSHKFSFLPTQPEKTRSEVFTIRFKADKQELGDTVQVIFEYKTRNGRKVEVKKQEIELSKRSNVCNFLFTKAQIQTDGRVEFFNVVIKDASGKQKLDKFKSSGQRLRL